METRSDPQQEWLEVVDEENRVIGLRRRKEIHGDPSLRHRAVHVAVFDRNGQLYLQKRSQKKRIQPGKWDTSVGGHVDPGESYEQAARRELCEELGVCFDEQQAATQLQYRHDYVWRSDVETEHVRTFELQHEGPFSLHPDEIDDGRFFSPDELTELAQGDVLTPNLVHELKLFGLI
jgi:isopentenyl-diphosphate delta-isomerase type 1